MLKGLTRILRAGTRSRIAIIYAVVTVLMFAALGRVFAISILDHEKYAERSRNNSLTRVPVKAERGRIISSDGAILAQTVFTGKSVYINARQVPTAARYKVAEDLGAALNLPAKDLFDKLLRHQNNAGLPLKYFLSDSESLAVRRLIDSGHAPGVHFRDRTERRYPKGKAGAQLVGFVNRAEDGSGGIELAYDRYLRGSDGRHEFAVDARSRGIPQISDVYEAPKDGADVHVTIDATIQEFTEAAIGEVVRQWNPDSAMAVVMETSTGRILAISNYPDFDPAQYNEAPPESMKNRALTDAWEPGSIFKPLIYSAAIEDGLIDLQTPVPFGKFYSGGTGNRFSGREIFDDYPPPAKYRVSALGVPDPDGSFVPLKVGLGKSLNVVAVHIGQSIYAGKLLQHLDYTYDDVLPFEGEGRLATRLRGFGFGAYSGIDIGGGSKESRGVLPSPRQWQHINPSKENGYLKERPVTQTIPSVAMGYGVQVTGVQMLNCFNAIALDGRRMKPYLVEKVVSRSGEVLLEQQPEVAGNSGFSAQTAAQMREILEFVVEDGTARSAKLKDYRLAGKTGTAKMLGSDGKYHEWHRRCTFVGFAPVENPHLTILVSVAAPKSEKKLTDTRQYTGGRIAAPAMADIMARSLKYLGVPVSEQEGK